MSINTNTSVPIYQQIADHVRGRVAAGIHRPGEMLPSIRALAIELVVNPNTVQRAYDELDWEGLVELRRGVGFVVTEQGVRVARNQLEQAARGSFSQGIVLARSANISEESIRGIFDRAMSDSGVREGGGT